MTVEPRKQYQAPRLVKRDKLPLIAALDNVSGLPIDLDP
jgi:hypothetical protein